MGMKSEEIRENEELDDGWETKKSHSGGPAARTGGRRKKSRTSAFLILLVAGLPVHMVVFKVLYAMVKHLARNGLTYFEGVLLISALWLVIYIYGKVLEEFA